MLEFTSGSIQENKMTKKTGTFSFKYVVMEISIMHWWFNDKLYKLLNLSKFSLKTYLLQLFVNNNLNFKRWVRQINYFD